MKIAIVSDTHNNFPVFNKIIEWLNKEGIKILLHCGDIESQEIIDEANNKFNGKIEFVKGNADVGLTNIPEVGEIKIGGRRIAFCHFPDIAKKLARSESYDIVFYGHTHRPWQEKMGNCQLINLGEVANIFYKSTFAVYDTDKDKLELKILEKL